MVAAASRKPWADRALFVAAVSLGTLAIAAFLVLSLYFRLAHPAQLEWMEGGILVEIRRILAGQAVYVRPSLDFIPFIYAPVFFYISAAATWICGDTLLAPRLVSFSATLMTAALLYAFGYRISKTKSAGWLTAAVYIAAFKVCGQWFDLARIDALAYLFAVAALYALHEGTARWSWILSAGLAVAAFYTKQTTAFMIAGMGAGLCISDKRRGLAYCAVVGLGVAMLWAIAHLRSQGWFTYYAYSLPASFPIKGLHWRTFLFQDLPLGLPLIAAAAALRILGAHRQGPCMEPLLMGTWAGALMSAFWSRIHYGAAENALMPLYLALALTVPFALSWSTAWRWPPLGHAAVALQLLLLSYNPLKVIPWQGDSAATQALVAELKALDGEVFLPSHPHLLQDARHRANAHASPLWDVMTDSQTPEALALDAELHQAMASGRYRYFLAGDDSQGFVQTMGRHYRLYRRLSGPVVEGNALTCVTGFTFRPSMIFRFQDDSKSIAAP